MLKVWGCPPSSIWPEVNFHKSATSWSHDAPAYQILTQSVKTWLSYWWFNEFHRTVFSGGNIVSPVLRVGWATYIKFGKKIDWWLPLRLPMHLLDLRLLHFQTAVPQRSNLGHISLFATTVNKWLSYRRETALQCGSVLGGHNAIIVLIGVFQSNQIKSRS